MADHEGLRYAAGKVHATGAEDLVARWELGTEINRAMDAGEFSDGLELIRWLRDEGFRFTAPSVLKMRELAANATTADLSCLIGDARQAGYDSPWEYYRDKTAPSGVNAPRTELAKYVRDVRVKFAKFLGKQLTVTEFDRLRTDALKYMQYHYPQELATIAGVTEESRG